MNKLLKISKLCVFLALLSLGQSLHAQPNFQPGFLVLPQGDSVFGLIDYRLWDKSPTQIVFKAGENGAVQVYKPLGLKSFGVANELYISAVVKNELTPLSTNRAREKSELVYRTDTAFLRVLYRGEKSLFFYRNPEGRDNLYIEKDGEPELLVYKKYLKKDYGRLVLGENRTFAGQLTVYLQECPTISAQLTDREYIWEIIADVFKNYYECTAKTPEYVFQHKRPIIPKWGVAGGAGIADIRFKGEQFLDPYLVDGEFNRPLTTCGGVFLDLLLPRSLRHFSVINELMFATYRVTGTYRSEVSPTIVTEFNTEIGLSYLKLNNMIRYRRTMGALSVFGNAGISNGMVVASTNYLEIINPLFTREDEALEKVRPLEFGFLAGGGVRAGRLQLELRYERGDGMARTDEMRTVASRYFVLLGFYLN